MARRGNIEWWLSEVGRSREQRERYASLYEWDKMRAIWDTGARAVTVELESNEQSGPREASQSSFVNWIWAFNQTFLPAVYWKHPQIRTWAQQSQWQGNAPIVETTINNTLEVTKFRRSNLLAMSDMLTYGHGWIKLGWYTKFGSIPEGIVSEETSQLQRPSTTDERSDLHYDQAYAVRVSPERMIVDPDATCYEELGWIIQESYVPWDAVKQDPYLKNTKDVTVLSFMPSREEAVIPESVFSPHQSRSIGWCRKYEIWDRKAGKVRVLLDGSQKWNRVLDWPYPDIEGFPFKFLAVTDAITGFYPLSPVLPWLPLVEELSFLRSIRMEHIQKMPNKTLVPPNMLDKDGERDLLDPSTDVVHTRDDPRKILQFVGMKPDPNLYASEDSVKSDIREISGFSEILSGQVPFSRMAATTSAIMERNATLRFDFYSERVGDFIIECAKDLFKIVRRKQNFPQSIMVTGDPNPEWMEINREQLAGDYVFKLDLEDMSISSKQQRVKEAYDALTALAPFPEVRRQVLIRDFVIALGKDPGAYMNPAAGPPLDPHYENSKLIQGFPIEPNMEEFFELHLQVHTNFISTPEYAQVVARIPEIGNLFSEHIQKTNSMAQMQQQLGPPVGQGSGQGAQVRPQPSAQQGRALAGSQPVGGQQTQQGAPGLNQALNQAMRL